jgi:hypothetical protein
VAYRNKVITNKVIQKLCIKPSLVSSVVQKINDILSQCTTDGEDPEIKIQAYITEVYKTQTSPKYVLSDSKELAKKIQKLPKDKINKALRSYFLGKRSSHSYAEA